MEPQIIAGIVVGGLGVVGTIIGVVANQRIKKYAKARSVICKLADQVAAYHKLESFYMERVAKDGPTGIPPRTVQIEMRAMVGDCAGFEYPVMTANEARKIKSEWS